MCVWAVYYKQIRKSAKTTTASSGCRTRPTAPDPVVSHGNSHASYGSACAAAGSGLGAVERLTLPGQTKKTKSGMKLITFFAAHQILLHAVLHKEQHPLSKTDLFGLTSLFDMKLQVVTKTKLFCATHCPLLRWADY